MPAGRLTRPAPNRWGCAACAACDVDIAMDAPAEFRLSAEDAAKVRAYRLKRWPELAEEVTT